MSKDKMIIGEKYEVTFSENQDGTFEKELQTLTEIKTYEGKEIYVFEGALGYPFATYNHGDNIDWEYMEEINDKFGY